MNTREGQHTHLLVADSDRYLRQSLEYILEAANYRVSLASTGSEALRFLELNQGRKNHVDLLIAATKLPDYSGTELIRKLRVEAIELPILPLIHSASDELITHLREENCRQFIIKPVRETELLLYTYRLLNK